MDTITSSVSRYPKEKNRVLDENFKPSDNFFHSDRIFRNYISANISPAGLKAISDNLEYTGREAAGRMNELSLLADKNGPQPIPFHIQKDQTAVCQAPPEINGVISGIIILSTKDFTRVLTANPIITAIASPITLYSLRNSLNSLNIETLF